MSQYGGYIPTSQQQAYPPAEWTAASSYPSQPRYKYGPPPAVPASLYDPGPSQPLSYATHRQPQHAAQWSEAPRRSKGREYLLSLGTSMAALDIGRGREARPESMVQRTYPTPSRPASGVPVSTTEKPLPRLPPPPPLPARPATHVIDTYPSLAPEPPIRQRPITVAQIPAHNAASAVDTPPKSFRPSPYLHLPIPPHTPPATGRPHSAPGSSGSPSKGKGKAKDQEVIDLTLDSPGSSSAPSSPARSFGHVTPRSPARLRRRGASDQPPSTPSRAQSRTPATPASASKGAASGSPANTAIRCAGYTRAGERCKRTVKVEAPYLMAINLNRPPGISSGSGSAGAEGKGKGKGRAVAGSTADHIGGDEEEDQGGRYCKDHAGMICGVEGFYSRDKPGLWIRFDDWVPPEIGQQTKALLRTTMESRLTAKESPGFIYAYELRDLQTATTSYFKVGRTDNVPRRIGEWTNQCQSKTPTLRDIFPLSSSRLLALSPTSPGPHTSATSTGLPRRSGTINRSFLPGAISSGTLPTSPPNPSVKRWEKLVHLELAELSASARPAEWEALRVKCADCGKVHREVFAIPRDGPGPDAHEEGEGCYQVVLEVVCRWERYTRMSAPAHVTSSGMRSPW